MMFNKNNTEEEDFIEMEHTACRLGIGSPVRSEYAVNQ